MTLRFIIFIALFTWSAGFLLSSIFPDSAYIIIVQPFLKKIYGSVCHQRIEKTFLLNGHYFLVCARCTGIYLGALVISLISLFSLPGPTENFKLLSISAIPMIIDVTATTTGIYPYSKFIALSTGLFFGSAVFVYILAVIENNFVDKPFINEPE